MRPQPRMYALAALALVGAGILTLGAEAQVRVGVGDAFALLCAALYAVHIAYLGTHAADCDAVAITFLQLLTAAVISTAVLLGVDRGALAAADLRAGIWPVLYLGCFSTCLCFFLQTWAQHHAAPAKAGILLSAEGLFGCVFSVLLGLDAFSWQLAAGGAVIVVCVVLTQLPGARDEA